jgi:hypothetical protein
MKQAAHLVVERHHPHYRYGFIHGFVHGFTLRS